MRALTVFQPSKTPRAAIRGVCFALLGLLLNACAGTEMGAPVHTDLPSSRARETNVYTDVPKFDAQPDRTSNAAPLPTTPTLQPAIASQPAIPVKVGLLVPLTGPQAPLGQAMLNAAQLALADLNATQVTLIPRDTTPGAANAARQALKDGATLIMGPIFAANVREAEAVTRPAHVPVLAFSTDWTIANPDTAVLGFLPFSQVARIVDYAAQQGSRQFAILIPETPYGMAVAGAVRDTLQRQHLPLPVEVRFNDKSLATAARNLAAQRFDTLILPVGGKALSSVTTALQQANVPLQNLRLVGTGLWDDDMVARSGIIDGATYAAPDPAKRAAFIARYQELYNAKPPRLSTLAYDTTALISAMSARGFNPAKTDNLHYPAGFTGIDGVFRIRPDNLNDRSLAVLQIKGNSTIVADPAPSRF